METATLTVRGMTCMGCVNSVTKLLKAAPGVTDARVTLEPPKAIINYDAAKTNPAQLKQAIEDAGYEAA